MPLWKTLQGEGADGAEVRVMTSGLAFGLESGWWRGVERTGRGKGSAPSILCLLEWGDRRDRQRLSLFNFLPLLSLQLSAWRARL